MLRSSIGDGSPTLLPMWTAGCCALDRRAYALSIAPDQPAADSPARTARIRGWQLWTIPRRGIAYALLVDTVALGLIVAAALSGQWRGAELARAALLAGTALAYTEAADRIERVRRFLYYGRPKVRSTPTSVWTFAGVLILSPLLAYAVITVIYTERLRLTHRDRSVNPHNVLFDWASVIAAAAAATAVHRGTGIGILHDHPTATLSVLAALLLYTGINLALAMTGMRLFRSGRTWRSVAPATSDLAFEATTLLLGVGAALFVTHLPAFTPALVLPIAMLHRTAKLNQLEAAARTDGKTGLLNATAWHELASQQLNRAKRDNHTAALFVLDMDHFKLLNDQHGHFAGDAALKAVADTLTQELRGYDAIGRHGGEEFVALLGNVTTSEALRIADRLRTTIHAIDLGPDLKISASIGIATYPADAANLDDLFRLADQAMYDAKTAGRNCIRIAAASPP
jgi:diguanylate cyclase (GGDEF)-like protein